MNQLALPSHWIDLPDEEFLKPDSGGTYRIPLMVKEPTLLRQQNAPVTSGVPIPENALFDLNGVRLLDGNGRELPLQSDILARWRTVGVPPSGGIINPDFGGLGRALHRGSA